MEKENYTTIWNQTNTLINLKIPSFVFGGTFISFGTLKCMHNPFWANGAILF